MEDYDYSLVSDYVYGARRKKRLSRSRTMQSLENFRKELGKEGSPKRKETTAKVKRKMDSSSTLSAATPTSTEGAKTAKKVGRKQSRSVTEEKREREGDVPK